MKKSSGIFAPAPRPDATHRLFCLPYAGGSSITYLDWQHEIDPRVELICIEPPGRGKRFNESPIARVDGLVTQLCAELEPWLDRPFSILGHSNGALVGFELARRLALSDKAPDIFFASAKCAPSLLERGNLHELTDEELIAELRATGGTPEEFFESPELIELFLPPIRADFALSETYEYRSAPQIRSDLVMLYGKKDDAMDAGDREAWSREFSGRALCHALPGGHFFVDEHPARVIEALNLSFEQLLQAHTQAS